eukprot:TRINITY_DN23466_c0_g1_i1.p1 TRINITY_DN23466_c0_g1~~TRINITY_DN23466_c0_g1_i1.p1  ORF type:complete len:510 (+),score=136.27 TRINITY_DN23466_c0_g1_i1:44-1531(+)
MDESRSKEDLIKELHTLRQTNDVYIKKILQLQVTNHDLVDQVERLKLDLIKSQKSEVERFEEVKIQAQRLMEAENEIEKMGKVMASIRAPAVHSPSPKNFSFGTKLKSLINTQSQAQLNKEVQEILLISGNNACADCGGTTTLPTWVSTTYKVLLCTRCAAIHRSMGTHISKIRSLTLDEWKDEELMQIKRGGNRKANDALLGRVDEDFEIPVNPDEFRQFVIDKYQHRKYETTDISHLPPKYEEPAPGFDWVHSTLHKFHDMMHNIMDSETEEPMSPLMHHSPTKLPDDFVPTVKSWQPQPVEDYCEPKPPLLTVLREDEVAIGPVQRVEIAKLLPFTLKRCNWIRTFCSIEHGSSLRTLYEVCHGKAPNLLVVRTVDGNLVGGFSMQAWEEQRYYHGTGQSFVFRFKAVMGPDGPAPGEKIETWRWSEKNEFFTLSHAGMLAFGGGSGPALCVNQSLSRGSTDACETYDCPPLLEPSDFVIQRLEVWTFDDEE